MNRPVWVCPPFPARGDGRHQPHHSMVHPPPHFRIIHHPPAHPQQLRYPHPHYPPSSSANVFEDHEKTCVDGKRNSLSNVSDKRDMNNNRARSRSVLSTASKDDSSFHDEVGMGSSTFMFFPNPNQPPIQLKAARKSGLLPAPPGSVLEVNNLLLLHPPTDVQRGFGGHTSKYEMYTCRVCSKTYDGKNARSVARRHLQDKHGVPLSVQARRSRWDTTVSSRPKCKKDVESNSSEVDQDWAVKNRQQGRVEKTYASFLEQFGPNGLATPGGIRLIAPKFRKQTAGVFFDTAKYLNGDYGNVIIPDDILGSIESIRGGENVVQENDDRVSEENHQKDVEREAPADSSLVDHRNRSHSPTPPHTLMSSLAVSPPSPPRHTRHPSYHHHLQTQQLERLRQQHVVLPYHFSHLPPIERARMANHYSVNQNHKQTQPLANTLSPLQIKEEIPDVDGKVSRDTLESPSYDISPKLEPENDIAPIGVEEISDHSREDKENTDSEIEDAAESLLNLHSTPVRGSDDDENKPIFKTSRPTVKPTRAHDLSTRLMDAPPDVSSASLPPPGPRRTIQPFKDPRPEVTRSLSLDQRMTLDDPFTFKATPNRTIAGQSASRGSRTGQRVMIPSPSPLSSTRRKRKALPSSPFSGPPEPLDRSRPTLRPLSTNFGLPFHGAATPVRSALAPHIPSSLTKGWLLSSPSTGDTAASLGLVPTHLAPVTPGLRGIIGTDTPERFGLLYDSGMFRKEHDRKRVKGKENMSTGKR
ncbi:uncharacterized protein L203_102605 [Cryptococcus depauperatus CBS 7841]|uniref:Uncharacterized protein n=1 Tax=Cryptococcus depauperatus CBS 7841 TaxID=1295531 RepID=A0A1E3IDR1_9TREE|nr:hypothetical protein L203_03971 [Cryptococcus depauperatus CBS 7841]